MDNQEPRPKGPAELQGEREGHASLGRLIDDINAAEHQRPPRTGCPMHELQVHMGHANISTTADYYTEVEARAAKRLRDVFKRKVT